MPLKDSLKTLVKGEIIDSTADLQKYSTDASIFEVTPQLVVAPQDAQDIEQLVTYCNTHPEEKLSLTPRAAATCMSGGSLSESIVVDMIPHFNKIIKVAEHRAWVQPGVYYRDFEKETLKQNLLLPCYTSSRELCTVGGMVGNNSAGEKTLSFGQTERYVKSLKVVLSDGKEYTLKPLTWSELQEKIKARSFEGDLYRKLYELVSENKDLIAQAAPHTSKNSTGYMLWKLWNGEVFDITKLLVGSQGTLGIVTEIEFELVNPQPVSYTLVITLHNLERLDVLINKVLQFKPESFECYDDQTLKAAATYYTDLVKDFKNSWGLGSYFKLIPEIIMKMKNKFPPLVLLAEFTGSDKESVIQKCQEVEKALQIFSVQTKILKTTEAEKYWVIRRQSFSLLRQHTKGMRTAPFIDDIIVSPENLPQFLPELNAILKPYEGKLIYTLAGHIGNGNFHIIPLMNFEDEATRELVPEVSEKVFDLVFKYKGSMAAEHNDGLVRGPYLAKMYGEQIYQLFKEVKNIFDPNNIFNPHKKVDATFEYSLAHLSKK